MLECGGRQRDGHKPAAVSDKLSVAMQAEVNRLEDAIEGIRVATQAEMYRLEDAIDGIKVATRAELNRLEGTMDAIRKQAGDSQRQTLSAYDMMKSTMDAQGKQQVSTQRILEDVKWQLDLASGKSDHDQQQATHEDLVKLKEQSESVLASVQNDIASCFFRLGQVETSQRTQQNPEDIVKQLIDSLVMPRLHDLHEDLQQREAKQQVSSANIPIKSEIIGNAQGLTTPAPPSGTDVKVDQESMSALVSTPQSLQGRPKSKTEDSLGSSRPVVAIARRSLYGTITGHGNEDLAFGGSVWDVALFIGVEQMHLSVSTFSVFLLLVNMTVQLFYTIIIWQEFTSTDFDEDTIKGYEHFRYQTAHQEKYFDEVGRVSLTTQICNGDASAAVAGSQAGTVALVNSYMPDETQAWRFFGEVQGQVMVILALITWCLVVSREARSILDTAFAMQKVRRQSGGQNTKLMVDNEGVARIVELSFSRFVFTVFMSAMRFSIVAFLLISGIKYLVHTTDLTDLVLNAVALAFVLDIDELLFDALAPTRVRALIAALEPLPIHHRRAGLDAQAIAHATLVSAAVAFAIPVWLHPEVTNLRRALDALCQGKQNFIYTTPNMPPYLQWADTVSASEYNDQSFTLRKIQDIVHQRNSVSVNPLQTPTISGGSWSLLTGSTWSVSVAGVKENQHCLDLMNSTGPKIQNLRELSGKQSCIHAHVDCNADTGQGQFVRMICPATCGCANGMSDLILTSPKLGCPSTCISQATFLSSMNISCIEKNPVDLISDSSWIAYADNLSAMVNRSGWPIAYQGTFQNIRQKLKKFGCDAIHTLKSELEVDLCDETPNRYLLFKSTRMMCPITCNCSSRPTSDRMYCPFQCYGQI